MSSNLRGGKETDFEISHFINKVSNIIENTKEYGDIGFIKSFDGSSRVSNSNFSENPEMIGKVWSNKKLDMKSTINSLVSNLANSFDSRDVENQIKVFKGINKNKNKLVYFASPNRQLEMERKVQYDSVHKEMKRWGKLIDNINRQEVLIYGKTKKTDILSTSQLSNNYEPIDEFEREFERVLLEVGNRDVSNNQKNINNHGTVLPCNKIRDQIESNFVKKLKFILFNQQRENKRIKKIKSKSWRKNRRKQTQIEEEKLISLGETEYPELVKDIKEKYEERRAKIRLMRRQSARRKWAKIATRFGGKEMQRNISNQIQVHYDEKKRIERIISNFSSDYEGSDNSDDPEKKTSEYINDSLERVGELKSISKELSDLKFIQRGIDSINEELELKLNQLGETGNESRENAQYRNDEKLNTLDVITPQVKLKKPTPDEINNAGNEIFNKSSVENYFNLCISLPEGETSKFNTEGVSVDVERKKDTKMDQKILSNFDIHDELEKMAQNDLDNDNCSTNNVKTIKDVFIQNSEDNICQTNNSNEINSEKECIKKKTTVPGWGSWCLSLNEIKEERSEVNLSKKFKFQTKQNRRIDNKIASYCVNKIPYPFNSNDLYESTLKHPIGPEWNTTSIHNKLIQPKIQARIGAVIKPLVYSKRLKNINISDSFLEKWNDAKKCNRTKARF
ncbi:hypothetical protein FG386_001147 [Cryptosporidium ryanae]|uniref:uncharacterized protein n=1 Tax=Cryptosporidium ryanae TaxID=515981 RepID=UPI00351A4B14|nr:hypothetical protein FG386_001147 [Cryptosporidium ryanae]